MGTEPPISRYETLHAAAAYALQKTLDKITPEAFASSFPGLDPVKLEFVRSQMVKVWATKAEREFKKVFHERELEKKLGDLDRILNEAQERYDRGGKLPDVFSMGTEEVVSRTTIPIIEATNNTLQTQLDRLRASNAELEAKMANLETGFKDDFAVIKDTNAHLVSLDNIDINEAAIETFVRQCITELSK